jgi:proteasome alpha subunit
MSMPFYVAPEQLVRDKAEFARKGIARGRSIIAVEFDGGLLLLAENPSRALQKISEVYDRIAFAGVGKYNEFETLRKAGIRQADVMGYLYSRSDVTAMGLATAFSQTLGHIFSHEPKPYEVEILICELGIPGGENRLFKISYDGTLFDLRNVAAIGGKSEALEEVLRDRFREGMSLEEAVALGIDAFREAEGRESEGWEAAVLEGTNGRRAFRRVEIP